MTFPFPCIRNLASHDVHPIVPWEYVPLVPKFPSKKLYKEWLAQESTPHCLYSGFMGIIPGLRTHKESNPIHSVHALIADYDAKVGEPDLLAMLQRAGDSAPSWAHATPSGGARLVWLIESPVLVTSPQVLMKMLRMAAKSLDMKALLPGFDRDDAFLNPTIYYDVGRDWIEIDGATPLARSLVEGWMLSASEGVHWNGDEIELSVVKEEIDRQFPNSWPGPFEVGARGRRFWDPMSDNDTAAIVRETGMQCFTGSMGFVPWGKILGAKFVEQHTSKRLGDIVEGVWYDGQRYWYESADGKWEARAEANMARWLKVDRGLSSDKEKNATFSEVDHALHVVDQHRRVAGAAPFIYRPAGMIEFMGSRMLNTSRVTALEPDEGIHDWGDGFPWVADFLRGLLNDPDDQLMFFLSWLKRFHESALAGAPRQGQAHFLIGPTGHGKTLLSNRIISGLMGGHQDASKFLLGDTGFNKELYHHGLWTIDDATPGDSAADHKKFSSLLKKATANTTFEYHAKFADATMVEWTGRVVITGNLDAESLRILPDCDTSILDKIIMMRVSTHDLVFPPNEELREIIGRELPFLAAYLRDFEIPEECMGTNRYGVASYHHPDLREAAGESTDAAVLGEILESFIAERRRNKEVVPWQGTATHLMQELLIDDGLSKMIGRNSVRWLGIQLGKLESQGRGVVSRRGNGRKTYVVDDPATRE